MLQRDILSPSSGSKSMPSKKPAANKAKPSLLPAGNLFPYISALKMTADVSVKHQWTSSRLSGIISQKVVSYLCSHGSDNFKPNIFILSFQLYLGFTNGLFHKHFQSECLHFLLCNACYMSCSIHLTLFNRMLDLKWRSYFSTMHYGYRLACNWSHRWREVTSTTGCTAHLYSLNRCRWLSKPCYC